jgi:hypothetical protein
MKEEFPTPFSVISFGTGKYLLYMKTKASAISEIAKDAFTKFK